MEPEFKCDCGQVYPRRQLRCPACSRIGVPRLYKYVRWHEFSLAILQNRTIWFPKARSLNDPLEFRFRLTESSWNGIPIAPDSIEQAIAQAKELGVLCLSEVSDSPAMWAHYAGNHEGFCLVFGRQEGCDLGDCDHCLPVIYAESDDVPAFSPSEIVSKEAFAKIATTKAWEWGYEQEWRLISKSIGDKALALPGRLEGVIIGRLMSQANREHLISLLDSSVRVWQADLHPMKYRLSIPDE